MQAILVSFFLFASIYFEVFMLLTVIERSKDLKKSPLLDTSKLHLVPSVTIVVPCFNEETTVTKTVESLLSLDYPTERLFISLVDDGSTDNTWKYISKWKNHPQINLHHKENGGKYTALNHGIVNAQTDLVGCLDADSFVNSDALRKIVKKFIDHPEVMAVSPSVKIWKPDTAVRSVQYIEYSYGILMKKLFSFLNAIHVTPGPFSIFRRSVFDEIGFFKHAHNTEDMEICLRLQKHGKKIENCHDADVYTVGPRNIKGLHKQRLRWTYGFIRNAFDYRSLFFNTKTGNIGFLTLPIAVIGIIGVVTVFSITLVNLALTFARNVQRVSLLNWHLGIPKLSFDWFFLSTTTMTFVAVTSFVTITTFIIASHIMTHQKLRIRDLVLYYTLYPLMALAWIFRSVYNVAFARATSWR